MYAAMEIEELKLYDRCREVSKAASESQKTKASAKDREDEFFMIWLAETTFFRKESDSAGAVGRAPQRSICSLGQSSEVLRESLSRLTSGSRHLVKSCVNGNGREGSGIVPDVGKTITGRCLASFGPVG